MKRLSSMRGQRGRAAAGLLAAAISVAGTGFAGADVIEFLITLDGAQENPPVDTPATGAGTATLDTDTNLFSWNIVFEDLSSKETLAHFHGPAPACENAGIIIHLPLGSPKVGSQKVSDEQAEQILSGLWYVNIHTKKHPPGEIRGQVYPAPLDNPIKKRIPTGDLLVKLDPIATGLTAPNWGISPPPLGGNRDDRLFVTDQFGILWAIETTTGDRTVFLDVRDRLVELGIFGKGSFDERGLLGVAFHPLYFENGLLYTYESHPVAGKADFSTMPAGVEANHQTVITEWTVPDPTNPDSVVDPGSAREILRIDQPQFNHNAGAIHFGPGDDLLYIALGDGGGADDRDGQRSLGQPIVGHGCIGNGQDLSNPLGAILRIDPLGDNSGNGQYGIPPDNPFVGEKGVVEEIFAYGFRNPFRFSFDPKSHDLIVPDVGQNDIEEIHIVQAGGNHGWRHKEGSFFFVFNGNRPGYVTDMPLFGPKDLVEPIAEYDHDDGIAVVGGFIYTGAKSPALEGRYIFGEFAVTFDNDGRLFYLDGAQRIREFRLALQQAFGLSLLGFGQDANGEVYALANATGTPFEETGVVLHVVAVQPTELNNVTAFQGNIVKGNVDQLRESDDDLLTADSETTKDPEEPNVLDLRIRATTESTSARFLDILVESSSEAINGTAAIRLRNWKAGAFDVVRTFQPGLKDLKEIVRNVDAADYIRESDGLILLSIRETAVATFTLHGFRSRFDQIQLFTH